jgi:transposase
VAQQVYPSDVQVYPSDVNEEEWALLASLIPPAKARGRPRTVDIQRVVNGLFYLLRSGCAWRYLPREYGPWQTVYW